MELAEESKTLWTVIEFNQSWQDFKQEIRKRGYKQGVNHSIQNLSKISYICRHNETCKSNILFEKNQPFTKLNLIMSPI